MQLTLDCHTYESTAWCLHRKSENTPGTPAIFPSRHLAEPESASEYTFHDSTTDNAQNKLNLYLHSPYRLQVVHKTIRVQA